MQFESAQELCATFELFIYLKVMANNLEERTYHFIYKTTNLINNKYYIGMHSTSDLEDGYLGSGKHLGYSIKKYDKKNFKLEILEFLPTREELVKREEEIVNLNEIAKKECMNLKVGGKGGFTIENSTKGGLVSGQIHSEKLKKDLQYREIFSKNHSKRMKDRIASGFTKPIQEKYSWKGKTHSKETKLKQSLAKVGKHKGEDNSQFGTCWITNGIENKKIKKIDLVLYPDPWMQGRVIK